MRVLHINRNYLGTTLHQTMIEHLDKLGVESSVFVPVCKTEKATIKPNDNVCVSCCINNIDRYIFDLKQFKIIHSIEKKIDVKSFDCIHAYTLFTDGNAAMKLAKKYKKPFVVAVRNTDVNDFFAKLFYLRGRGVKILREAKKIFFLSDLTDADLEEMDQILAILREKDPLPPGRSVEELWEEFQTVYMNKELADLGIPDDLEEVNNAEPAPDVVSPLPSKGDAHPVRPKRYRKLIRVALVAAVVVAFMAAISVTAAAMGYNLWGWLPIWSNEDVRFVSETPTAEPREDDTHGIPSVLASLGITEPLYPSWLPEDLKRTETKTFEEPLFLYENFMGNNRELSITISSIADFGSKVYQKEDEPPIEYTVDSVIHYLIENTDELSAVWHTEDYTVLIVGNVTENEMKKIIDSIYEVKS